MRMWEGIGNPHALLVEMETGTTTVLSSINFPQKNKNRTALWHSNSTSGNLSKETQNTNLKEYMHPYIHCTITYNGQYREPVCVAVANIAQSLIWKTSGSKLVHRKWAHRSVFPWGIRPALYLGCFETCFLLKLPHPELRQQMFTAYL